MESSRLSKTIQHIAKGIGIENLNDIQKQSIDLIFDTKKDVIISAPTASGKTEAALLPTIDKTYPEIKDTLKILYISPLIALINDQYERLEEYNNNDIDLKIKITKWHSEVKSVHKRSFEKRNSGILLITPESLESFLVNRKNLGAFKNIEYVIIDEFHGFLGEIRGDHLKSLLRRVNLISDYEIRKVLLSATLNGYESCKKWLGKDDVGKAKAPGLQDGKKSERSIQYFEKEYHGKYYQQLKLATNNNKSLVFGNSKAGLEYCCKNFKEFNPHKDCEIHHGSLSREARKEAEDSLNNKSDVAVFCTSTLELGINIKGISQVSLIEPPFSASSFVQRIGRSGRTKGSVLKFNLFPTLKPPRSNALSELKIPLIQSVALEKLREKRWVEPKDFQTYTYSVFVHQIISNVSENAEIEKNELYSRLKDFHEKVSQEEFQEILNYLIENKYLSQLSNNNIILGMKGRELVKEKDFYSVFSTEEVWNLHEKGEKFLGTVSRRQIFNLGMIFLFSGKLWEVKEVFSDTYCVQLEEFKGEKNAFQTPLFISGAGDIHRVLHQEMKNIYEGSDVNYNYLNPEGIEGLINARKVYKEYVLKEKFLPVFMGSKVTRLILFILNNEGISSEELQSQVGICSSVINSSITNDLLLKKYSAKSDIKNLINKMRRESLYLEKYDYLLPDSILRKSYLNHGFSFDDYSDYLTKIQKESQSA